MGIPARDQPDKTERRLLSDADVAAIVHQLRKEVLQQFYTDIGRGVWAMAQRVFIMGLVALAAYGFFRK